jgi:regulator of RNase E activity RraA
MVFWKNDAELFELAKKELFTALVGDSLDKLGFQHQFLPQNIKPLSPDMVIIGRAMPVLEADVYCEISGSSNNSVMEKPFGLMFEALDSLKRNEVYVCSGSSYNYALWGGLMSIRALGLNAAGAVLNGFSRDTNQILNLGFPTFSAGTYAQDQGPRGKVIDYHVSIELGGVRICPGDIIFGDRDGVLVIPAQMVEDAFKLSIEKSRGEKVVQQSLEKGMSTVEAFKTFGIM